MSCINASLLLDASGVLTWKLLNFLAGQRPSAQQERGDRCPDDSCNLATENEALLSPGDLRSEVVWEECTLTADIKVGLESKKGLSRYFQARECHKSANYTHRFVKTVSDRAKIAAFGQGPRVVGTHPVLIDPHAEVTSLNARLGAEMKPKIVTLVEYIYGFNTSRAHKSISSNAKRAQMLLRDMNFVYPDSEDMGTGKRHNPYRHPIIQRAINITWFRSKDDVGVVFHERFSPMPISVIALALAVVECCIDEWSDGTRRDSGWNDERLQIVYSSHVASLYDFKAHSPRNGRDLLHQLQCDLLRDARTHAGVPPNLVTDSGRLPPDALDTIYEGDS